MGTLCRRLLIVSLLAAFACAEPASARPDADAECADARKFIEEVGDRYQGTVRKIADLGVATAADMTDVELFDSAAVPPR